MEASPSSQVNENRIKLSADARERLFADLYEQGHKIETIAKALGVHPRSIRDWKRGKFTIPYRYFLYMVSLSETIVPADSYEIVSKWWYVSGAGQKGGKAYIQMHKALGSKESRSKGGMNSYAARRSREDDIFTRQIVAFPEKSEKLAEFIGIMIGDGSIGKYQVSVTLDLTTDMEYASYVTDLIEDLFHIRPKVYLRKNLNCIVIAVSAASLVEYLHKSGLPIGDKIRQNITIPDWVTADTVFLRNCLRGLFDTDGSVYAEVHQRKGKTYSYPRLSLVSSSPLLRTAVFIGLKRLAINASLRNDRDVKIERFTDIEKYFKVIGSSNPKHVKRWALYGGVG